MTRAKFSRERNKEVMMCCKAITADLFTVVCLIVEPRTYISKPKGYMEAYIILGNLPEQ